jgi:TIGR03009 family protein
MSQHLAFQRLRLSRALACVSAVVFMAVGLPLVAQDRELDRDIAPNNRVARSSLTRPDLHRDPVDPEVDQLLSAWSDHTKEIKNLAGKHFRATRNFVYGTETLAEGKFFVEMPDKGRFDVGTYTPRGPKSPKPGDFREYPAANGTPTKMEIKSAQKLEKWICDGKIVRVIDDSDKSYEEVKIPPDQQGSRMIDGPLPFLLGMPPDKAKARYRFSLGQRARQDAVWIEVRPKLEMDATEWARAYVLLNLKNYLPESVILWDPAATTQTIYYFRDFKLNQNSLLQQIFGTNPFSPNLTWYRRIVHAPPAGDPKNPLAKGPPMPLIVGASAAQAKRIGSKLQQMGYDVKYVKGSTAPTADQEYHIESQQPKPDTPLQPGQPIVMRYYDAIRTVTKQPPEQQ